MYVYSIETRNTCEHSTNGWIIVCTLPFDTETTAGLSQNCRIFDFLPYTYANNI